ncbi:ubiquitin-like modifier-activating enzyme ATG7 isoform X2 [Palaemon carinicauda]|uniref:ubiquitin-like modifier-activating enzyme ATG7 isoform X2 n=1 Tax=Palaemon carinicauda TaxID=392227 RepID=UPI0035B60D6D
MGDPPILQFAPFSSAVDAGFWHRFTQLKLDVLHLSEEPVDLVGSYANSDAQGLPTRLSVEYDALDGNQQASSTWSCSAPGTLINTNTIEEFKNRDKVEILRKKSTRLWEAITSGDAIKNPSVLASFLMFTFADLKKYHYYYWFAFPAFTLPRTVPLVQHPQPITSVFTDDQISSLLATYSSHEALVSQGFYSIALTGNEFTLHPLSDYPTLRESSADNKKEVFLGFSDPCTLPQNPGWPLRNLLTLVALKWSKQWPLHRIICLRVRTRNAVKEAAHSIVAEVNLEGLVDPDSVPEMPQCLGWEKNERGKMGPRMVNLSASMDPTNLAESAVDLNLKLMRWRVAPDLDLGVVQNTKCLLLGAGTLGCAVARCLMGWGVRNITFVDNGKVSFSNPVRQSLFNFSNCLDGGHPKAEAAARTLVEIFPKMNARGVAMNIPMPGHTVGESLKEQVKQDVASLEKLVEEHDALFLLMDSRESRWLPTLLGAAKHKLVFTAALGFDSYLVMRHGYRGDDAGGSSLSLEKEPPVNGKPIPGNMLGCYFCNDVVAPGDSTQDRTLDQQCTVTRPGVSYLASAHIVELMVSLLQHPDRGLAEAQISQDHDAKEGVLGSVPHSLRGFLCRQQHLPLATCRFQQCPACGDKIIAAYRSEGFDFLLEVFNSPKYLEEVAGLGQLQQCAVESQIWELSDSEEDEE